MTQVHSASRQRVPAIRWEFVAFDALSAQQLYAVLQLRSEVFMLEQDCVFQDMDGTDAQAMHLLGLEAHELVAYARCFAAGVKFAQASIGRVLTRNSMRGCGLGHVLMQRAMAALVAQWGEQAISISAQARLEDFYRQHGFAAVGQPYREDGIAHIEMLRPAQISD
ncbi:MAG: GNAT family N-acetyltransferase [Betaproteobacteria bacterium]